MKIESITIKEYDQVYDRQNDKYNRNMIFARPHSWYEEKRFECVIPR